MGYAVTSTAESCKEDQGVGQRKANPVIGFDMGGTSTDVSRFDGSFEHIFESTTAGVSIRAPQVMEKRRRNEPFAEETCLHVCVFVAGYQHSSSLLWKRFGRHV